MKRLLFVLALGFTSLARAESAPPATAAADAAITQLREGLVDSFFKGDIDRALTFLAPDVVVTWQNGEVSHGPQEVRAYYQRMMTGPDRVVREVKAQPEVLGRQVYGDWAVSWGNLHDRFTLMDGRELDLGSRFTIVTARRGDRWLVTAYHASVNAFENPILQLGVRKVALWVGVGAALAGLIIGWLIGRARKS
jgi:ketosteroid isomerase-like protein